MPNLVPFSSIRGAVAEISSGDRRPVIPVSNLQPELNDINQLAYSIIKEGLYELTAKDISFLGSMAKTAGNLSVKQRKYLKDLCKRHLGYDFDEAA